MDLPPGVITGIDALKACGMQHEFAAHLTLLTAYTKSIIIIRACHAPNFDRKYIAPKPSYIKAKTSQNQGFFNSYIAVNALFQRLHNSSSVQNSVIQGLDKDITDPAYIHQTQLTVNTHDLIKQLGTDGDLLFDNYDPVSTELRLKFKPNKGTASFRQNGRFVLKLNESNNWMPTYTRPWNVPSTLQTNSILQNLDMIPSNQILNKEFKLYFQEAHEKLIKPAMVLAEPPKTIYQLKTALKTIADLLPADFPILSDNISYEQALLTIGEQRLQQLYTHPEVARVITGDWDGLALGVKAHTAKDFLTTYNTFLSEQQIIQLVQKAENYFEDLKLSIQSSTSNTSSAGNKSYQFIAHLKFSELIQELPLKQLGRITPAEFVFQQLINYAYKIPGNNIFGQDYKNTILPHPDADLNVINLFQHGFDMHNPHGPEADGGWLMIANGMQFYGEHQSQLTELLLMNEGELLKTTYFEVNHEIDMRPVFSNNGKNISWGAVVQKQIELNHPVAAETKEAYLYAQMIYQLEKKYKSDSSILSVTDANTVYKFIIHHESHRQFISSNLLNKYCIFVRANIQSRNNSLFSQKILRVFDSKLRYKNSLQTAYEMLEKLLPKDSSALEIQQIKNKLNELLYAAKDDYKFKNYARARV